MQIGMQVVTDITVLFYQPQRRVINDKLFLETIPVGSLIICLGDVAYGDALAAILGTNPVGIGKIDANGRRGIFLTAQHSGTDGIGRHAFYLRLTKTRVNRRMVFKPLGITADGLGTFGSLQVLILHDTFPRAFQPQRVAIDFNEAIYKIHPTFMFCHPCYAVVIEHLQVTGLVITYQQGDDMFLMIVLRNRHCLLQPIDDMLDGIGITLLSRPYILTQYTIHLDEC